MAIYELDGIAPQLGEGAFVADSAEVIGNVGLGKNASVWSKTVVRGDNDQVVIGDESNVQDASVLHSDPGFPLIIGKRVSIGHKVMLHGCTIGDGHPPIARRRVRWGRFKHSPDFLYPRSRIQLVKRITAMST